jgi:hypothetical protein
MTPTLTEPDHSCFCSQLRAVSTPCTCMWPLTHCALTLCLLSGQCLLPVHVCGHLDTMHLPSASSQGRVYSLYMYVATYALCTYPLPPLRAVSTPCTCMWPLTNYALTLCLLESHQLDLPYVAPRWSTSGCKLCLRLDPERAKAYYSVFV